MILFPNTKINLGLNIINRRSDGYHDIESCFYPVGWCDALEIVQAGQFFFKAHGQDIPGSTNDNLCIKAYNLLKKDFELPDVNIHLLKKIPIGAGLGGGSADCAFTLKILNQLFDLNCSDKQLEGYAAELGSDCPFFIRNRPVIATETGTTLTPLKLDLKGLYIYLVHPGIHISTAEAYSGVTPRKADVSVTELMDRQKISEWRALLRNDFETSVFPKYPILRDIKEKLYRAGAVYSSMTGSGSALYGIFEKEIDDPFPQYRSFAAYL